VSEASIALDSSAVVAAARARTLPKAEETDHYVIFDVAVKSYPATTFLVQTSSKAINLGEDMLPYLDTAEFWQFVAAHDVPVQPQAPREAYLYNWVDKAQGPMVFDVGVTVEDSASIPISDRFVLKKYPPMNFASIVYEGPFPHEPDSGWDHIRWEDRAREKGLVYTQRLYRELYHDYDYTSLRHITEVQIEIE